VSTRAREPLGVIGVGWVGLVTAASFANLGHDVIGLDVDRDRVAALARGEVSLHEPGLTELVRRNAARLRFTSDPAELFARARVAFVCVDTPPPRPRRARPARRRLRVQPGVPARGDRRA